MELACSSWSLRGEIPDRLSLLEFPAWCGARGIPAIEIAEAHLPSRAPAYLAALRRACGHAAVRLACLAVENDFTLPDAARRGQEIEHVRRALYEIASPLQIPTVRVALGLADPTPAGEARALEAFRGLAPDLERLEVALALEHPAPAPEALAALIAGVGTPLFGCCLDLGSAPAERRLLAWSALAPLARHVHARTSRFTGAGDEADIPYPRAFAVLRAYGYDGTVAILYDGAADPYLGVLMTKALIERTWAAPAGAGRKAA